MLRTVVRPAVVTQWRRRLLGLLPLGTVSGTFSDVLSTSVVETPRAKILIRVFILVPCDLVANKVMCQATRFCIVPGTGDEGWAVFPELDRVGELLLSHSNYLYTCCGTHGVIPAFGRPRQEDYKFETLVDAIMSSLVKSGLYHEAQFQLHPSIDLLWNQFAENEGSKSVVIWANNNNLFRLPRLLRMFGILKSEC